MTKCSQIMHLQEEMGNKLTTFTQLPPLSEEKLFFSVWIDRESVVEYRDMQTNTAMPTSSLLVNVHGAGMNMGN